MKYLISIIILSALIGVSNDVANAGENLEDWSFSVWQGNITITPSGTVANVQTPGSDLEEWSSLSKNFPNALGLKATVNISNMNGRASIAIRKYVGTNAAGNRILAEIYLYEGNDKKIEFKVRERDAPGNTLKVIATGHPGEWNSLWSLGQNVEIGLARISDYEICFYTPANSAFIIIKLSEKMDDFDSDVVIYGWTAPGSNNTLTGTVSNVDIIYSDNLMVFKDALPQKSVVVIPMN